MQGRESRYVGTAVDFAPIEPCDDFLHAAAPDAAFTAIETYLLGFNIPEENIQSNIYLLWHPLLRILSAHVFVYRGARILPHQLAADYFNEHLFLPAPQDLRDHRFAMGSCSVRINVAAPLEDIQIEMDDPAKCFSLQLGMRAAMPPVGRPGGKHFTQLMRTSGTLILDGQHHKIDGHYMRDRSWGYPRAEQPERTPPYRWMTGWFGEDCGFVMAWIDTAMLDEPQFGPDWARIAEIGQSKWESGGPTPSLNLRSGWFATAGKPRPIVRVDICSLSGERRLVTRGIELEIEDADGGLHRLSGETVSMIPKMYWGNLLTNMHFMRLTYGSKHGHGDLMDTFSADHIKHYGS